MKVQNRGERAARLRKLLELTPAERLDRNWRLAQLADKLLATVIVEEHPDAYVASTQGLQGVIVGEGSTAEEALADVQAAILFHVETFGEEALGSNSSASQILID